MMNEETKTIQPCKDCDMRHTACHDECERYKAWKKKFKEAKKNQRDYDRILQDDIWHLLTS